MKLDTYVKAAGQFAHSHLSMSIQARKYAFPALSRQHENALHSRYPVQYITFGVSNPTFSNKICGEYVSFLLIVWDLSQI